VQGAIAQRTGVSKSVSFARWQQGAIAQRTGINKSVSFARWHRGRGLLCLAPQLAVVLCQICKNAPCWYTCNVLWSLGNSGDFLDILKRFTFQGILNAPVSVDSFFLLGYMCYE